MARLDRLYKKKFFLSIENGLGSARPFKNRTNGLVFNTKWLPKPFENRI
jgi:hypothetical protein